MKPRINIPPKETMGQISYILLKLFWKVSDPSRILRGHFLPLNSIHVNSFLSFSRHLHYDSIGVYNFCTAVLTNLCSTNAAGLFPTLPTSPTEWTQSMIWEEDCVIKASVGGLIEISKLSLNKQTLKDSCRNIAFQ